MKRTIWYLLVVAAFQRNIEGGYLKIVNWKTQRSREIANVPGLQVGKLRHQPLKSFQKSSKGRDGELGKDPEEGFTRTQPESSSDLKTRDEGFPGISLLRQSVTVNTADFPHPLYQKGF